MSLSTSDTPRKKLAEFYEQFNLGNDGGQSKSYVKIELGGGLAFYLPNVESRKKAVVRHDVHHLLTGYSGLLAGESEISAWELRSGCWKYPFAFFINLSGMLTGLLFNVPAVFRAWTKGRSTTNLYQLDLTEDEILDTPTEQLKKTIGWTETPEKATLYDYLSFLGFALLGILFALASIVALPFIALYSIYIALTEKTTTQNA
ncbi:MAG: hypothetical protein ACRCYO_19945 [Bacteroidia bacterium]